jgi:hypothetical protein
VEGEDGSLAIARSGVWVFWKLICLVGSRRPGSAMCRFMLVDV